MEPGLGGPDGDVEDGCRFGQRQIEMEVQDDDHALVVGKAVERRRQDLSVRYDSCEVGVDDGIAVGLHVQLHHIPPP